MILITLDRKKSSPLYMQIVEQIQELVETDTLAPETPLPATRKLADQLGVDRSTVITAYDELSALGYLNSRPGSYYKIRQREKLDTPVTRNPYSLINWKDHVASSSQVIYDDFLAFPSETARNMPDDIINMARLDMDPSLFPISDFRRCLQQVLKNSGNTILSYGDYMGLPLLRQEISNRLRSHGISVIPEEILITHGSQNGLELVLKLFAKSGKKVVIESPTYAILLPLLKYYGFETIAIPMTQGGVNLNALKKVFQKNECAFFYTMPNFHNPTGITTTQSHREKLLSICEQYKVPIVEDGFEEEMKYFGKVPPPIKSMDKNQIVIYLGTFSKVLFPGIRIGWMAAEKECIQRLVAIKRFSSLTSSPLLQSAISEFLKQGYYARHIQKMKRIFKKRMQVTLQSLDKSISLKDVSWTRPTGGYLIWMELKNISITEEQFLSLLNRHKIWVSLGTSYFTSRPVGISFRLSISTIDQPEIIQGIQRLGALLKEAYRDFK